MDIETIARSIVDATDRREPLDRIFPDETGLTPDRAFRVQQEVVRLKVERGDAVAGVKLGNIAKAMQNRFGIDQPDFGYIMAHQFHPENVTLPSEDYIQPFVELEPAFVLKRPLGGKHTTSADVIRATDCVIPSLEIIDSRVRDWDIGIFDTLADSGSTGAIVLGSQPRSLSDVNLADMPGRIDIDGRTVLTGHTPEIYGSPISAIAWLCRRLSEYGITFSEGDVVLPGSCLEAIEMQPGTDLEGVFEGWGGVRVRYGS